MTANYLARCKRFFDLAGTLENIHVQYLGMVEENIVMPTVYAVGNDLDLNFNSDVIEIHDLGTLTEEA